MSSLLLVVLIVGRQHCNLLLPFLPLKLTIVFCDNQSVIDLRRNPKYHERTKHIDVGAHFIRDVIADGAIVVKKVATAYNPVNMMTKINYSIHKVHALRLVRSVT